MPEQAGLFNALDNGLWKRFVTDERINHGPWLKVCAEGGFVGTCRVCGNQLRPERPRTGHNNQEDYAALCVSCGAEMVAPGGRVLRRSSRRSERPTRAVDRGKS